MFNKNRISVAVATTLALSCASGALFSTSAMAQDATEAEATVEKISITGSRIRSPGTVSASPITSIGADEIAFQQQPEIERVLRNMPFTIPGDGGNVNNGTAGAATVDLRGLGSERNLILLNGKRMVPYNYNGRVDTATIPSALIERIDVVTGGASAVYGSDAIAGAVNFVLKRDFEGVEVKLSHGESGEGDGDTDNLSITIGSNFDDDKGNAAISMSWMDRKPIMLGDRPLGLLGINTKSGLNYKEFQEGLPPVSPPTGCGGPDVVAIGGGSTTAIPTRFAIVGAGVAGQFREDRSLGSNCSEFNFNPYNFYQTPMERYSATAVFTYDVAEEHTINARVNYTNITVDSQVAPSGTFGQSFELPLYNPYLSSSALSWILDGANSAREGNRLNQAGLTNWWDNNNNGVVDSEDSLLVQLRRRTLELGARTERYDTDAFQFVLGMEGALVGDWEYEVSYQYGESNRTTVRDGYTNLTNIQNALKARTTDACENGDPTCVPIDLFGGFGTITESMAGYARAIALQQQKYEQEVATIAFTGPVDGLELPTAAAPLSLSIGYEKRKESGLFEPDECLKLAPASCQGGAGGNSLPVRGGFSVDEIFLEGMLPIFDGQEFADAMNLEFGYRRADYDSVGTNDTWKLGLNYKPFDSLLLRVMKQQATRAPNVGELASPVTTSLNNATQDPCSVANAANIDATLRALCISTGMTDSQVGNVQDVISGQVNTFGGSDPQNLPGAEEADTFTAGFVWTPDFDGVQDFVLSLDYYDIDIANVIGEYSAQEILDACYVGGMAEQCAKINRVGGDLTVSGSGINRYTTNLAYRRAEGLELALKVGFDLGDAGSLSLNANVNKYLTAERQSDPTLRVIDCKGYYSSSCDPLPEMRFIQRTTWDYEDLTVSLNWRYIDAIDVEPVVIDSYYKDFRHIGSYSYFDLFASYQLTDYANISLSIDNLFEREPPVVGGEAGETDVNSGNTFPSDYDVLGRMFRLGVNLKF
ncbi:TonB-dependent receptor [Bowmanella sp. Y26]|uniref:TonB-dependent receptor domain-containing protein n=1 Tax=Bowmanella yangjiangensis TaxID=2811230 RepID=UPI001BDD56E2|nr:TonB-dependent receptor [Bowmanella yangjiangensis]MBT1064721.1 TonB-dependent receptor [Bowmanella yangjiangensis]